MKHEYRLIVQDEIGDLIQCTCGFQGWDFKQGKEVFAKHLDEVAIRNVEDTWDLFWNKESY